MTKDIEALLKLPEEQLRKSFGDHPLAKTLVDLVLELRANDRTVGERAANAIFASLVRQSDATLAWSHPRVAEMCREWAAIIDKEVAGE